jgi:hypothetical protein
MESVTTAVGRFGGVRLGTAGAAFELDRNARGDSRIAVGQWVVETRSRNRFVVIRGRARTYKGALRAARNAAEVGLDMLSLGGRDDLALATPGPEHIAWWTRSGHRTVRIVSIATRAIGFEARITVRDAAGRLVRSPSPGSPSWHSSFRFFRLSQTSNDLFDACRNAYLALEAMLSHIAPQRLRRRGVAGETDKDWFIRALRSCGVNLAVFAAAYADPALAIYHDIYLGLRVKVFHAKTNRPALLPRRDPHRLKVLQGLDTTRRLYLAIVEQQFAVRRSRSGFSSYAFQGMADGLYGGLRVFISGEATALDAEFSTASRGSTVTELGRVGPIVHAPGSQASRTAWADFVDLPEVGEIRQAIGSNQAGLMLQGTLLLAALELGDRDRLEVEFGLVLKSWGQLRDEYV